MQFQHHRKPEQMIDPGGAGFDEILAYLARNPLLNPPLLFQLNLGVG